MRTISLLVLIGICLSCNVFIAAQEKNAPKKKENAYPPTLAGAQVEVYKKIGDVTLNAYVFQPKQPAESLRPAIVFFFGGGWNAGSPTQFEQHCRYFSERGMVAITADYRVASRHGVKAVACVADAKSAIRWVRANASRLGVDPDRIMAAGGSAGGHLAAATGTIQKFDEAAEDKSISSVPNAMALFNPALVLAAVEGESELDTEKLASLGERMGVAPQELSPFHQMHPLVPPTIIFHGQADTTVPYRTAELFDQAMKQHDRACTLIGYEGATHGFFNYGRGDNEHFQQTIKALDKFLVELKYLSPSL